MHASLNPPVQVKPLYSIHPLILYISCFSQTASQSINSYNNITQPVSFEKDMNKIRLRALSSPSGWQHRGKRCPWRGRNYVRPEVKQSNFSKDEDDLILKLHALLGNRWSLIAGRLPGRTDNEVRIHWETYLKRKLMKMGIDPTNHRLHHHTNYISRRYLNSSHKEYETKIISDQSSSVSESCDMTTVLPISSINCSEDSTSSGRICLPDLNIGLIPTVTSLPACCLDEDSSESSNYGSTGQETLLLFR